MKKVEIFFDLVNGSYQRKVDLTPTQAYFFLKGLMKQLPNTKLQPGDAIRYVEAIGVDEAAEAEPRFAVFND